MLLLAVLPPLLLGGQLLLLSAAEALLSEEFGATVTLAVDLLLVAIFYTPANAVRAFNVLVDPSGSVLDVNGGPVPGATVVLEQAPTSDGPFVRAKPASPGIEPHLNPETTTAAGEFHWEVVSDYYKVVASAPGCHAPGHPGEPLVSTAALPVPPPQVGLDTSPAVRSRSNARAPGRQLGFWRRAAVYRRHDRRDRRPQLHAVVGSQVRPALSRSVTWASPELLTVTAPAGRGNADVTVTTAGGTSRLRQRRGLHTRPSPWSPGSALLRA